MRAFILSLLLVLVHTMALGQAKVSVMSWNLQNMGHSKKDSMIEYIAQLARDFDVVAIQEVVAGRGGAQAVARLHRSLNRKGTRWDYRVSDPTTGENPQQRERYAFLWKTARVQLVGRPWLDSLFEKEIVREPYFATFRTNGKTITLGNFHAVPKKRQPEREIKYFKQYPKMYPGHHFVFLGDFNCPQSHSVFNPLKKRGVLPVFRNQKTTLKMRCVDGNCLASEYDNFYYDTTHIRVARSGVIHFYQDFSDVVGARKLSDHLPIWAEFYLLD